MKKIAKKIINLVLSPFILPDYLTFKKKDVSSRFMFNLGTLNPQIKDKTVTTGFDRHYVYHTSWAARKVKEINPTYHIDISSSLYFSGIVSAFIPVHFYDYRPANLKLSDLESYKGDLMNLPFETNSVKSISCMHTIEHIGLGRYGDPIDPDGDIKAIEELKRVVAPSGNLILVVPMGNKAVIEFNAHRIYSYNLILSYFSEFELIEFSLIPEDKKNGELIEHAKPEVLRHEKYACGCFLFKKK